jgi:hypothetical protein
MEGIGEKFGQMVIVLCVICIGITGAITLLVCWISGDSAIRTTERIKPDIELVVKDNRVDTIYIYKVKK